MAGSALDASSEGAVAVGDPVGTGAASHAAVEHGLQTLRDMGYRSGFNAATGESDGAGIRIFPLPTAFLQDKFGPAAPTLVDGAYGLGHYFLPRRGRIDRVGRSGATDDGNVVHPVESTGDDSDYDRARAMVEACAHDHGLAVAAWRDTTHAVDPTAVSPAALARQPSMAQAILVRAPATPGTAGSVAAAASPEALERSCLAMGLDLADRARRADLAISVVSQSTTSVVYKGMILPDRLRDFFDDLRNPAFTAVATSGHVRFATNTAAQWAKAQPCPFVFLHNGELTSARANGTEMEEELAAAASATSASASAFAGLWPSALLSDSMQFDADIANQMVLHGISMPEALVRLMPPPPQPDWSEEARAMLAYFRLLRTPYNGPAFMIGSYGGWHLLKSDSMGLRPTRWAVTEDAALGHRQFQAASDDLVVVDVPGRRIVTKENLAPGGMILVTPHGRLLHTAQVLDAILDEHRRRGDRPDHFQRRLQQALAPSPPPPPPPPPAAAALGGHPESHDGGRDVEAPAEGMDPIALAHTLYAAYWDRESEDAVLFMAQNKAERLGAMGDDTNPLPSAARPAHLSGFFHQLFAQVSAPPLDSIREADRFSLACALGPRPGSLEPLPGGADPRLRQVALASPFLGPGALARVLDAFPPGAVYPAAMTVPAVPAGEAAAAWADALLAIEQAAEAAAATGGVVLLSDRATGPTRVPLPDLMAVAAVKQQLARCNAGRRVSVVVDSMQVHGPHQASTLLAVGADAVYPRGAYARLGQLASHDGADPHAYAHNYRAALDKCLLKTMGKVGITDVRNYIYGQQLAVLGLDLAADPVLGRLFGDFANEFGLRGLGLDHILAHSLQRHRDAYAPTHLFTVLPRAGHYMPEKGGAVHGYGPEVVHAFTHWMKEEDVRAVQYQLHRALVARGLDGFVRDAPTLFSPESGFLDPQQRRSSGDGDGGGGGAYPVEYLATVRASPFFADLVATLDAYSARHPTSLKDYFLVRQTPRASDSTRGGTQPTAAIRACFFSGSMSQGALTVADPDTPDRLGAHETLTRAVNAVGVNSASGEGGEAAADLRDRARSTRSKQVASGRFGVSAMQIRCADEIEIKVAQGAKPGEGGELPKAKVTVRIAAQRGSLPGTGLISPPPHHDIYSIEDLEQLIFDIKSVRPDVSVCVKLVASDGIGTIAVGVAKAGADVINLAGNSGGTAAAQQSSIKHAGLPAELALVSVGASLERAHLRDRVRLRTSGGFKTPDDVVKAAILGADLFELGTTAMLSLGCKMQRTCNQSCKPGVATDGANFHGDRLHTERYFVFLAAAVRDRLDALGVPSLAALRGRTDLLVLAPHADVELHGLAAILQSAATAAPAPLGTVRRGSHPRPLEDQLTAEVLRQLGGGGGTTVAVTADRPLGTADRTFGARLTGNLVELLERLPGSAVVVRSRGVGVQSVGFALAPGITLHHAGTVGDGCGKSMSGGTLVVQADAALHDRAHTLVVAGNAALYGASGGRAYLNGIAGHRFGILLKGAEAVVEGVGDLALEYMTSGTVLILGGVGRGLGVGASGGVILVHDVAGTVEPSADVRALAPAAAAAYLPAIRTMLEAHVAHTGSVRARSLLAHLDPADYRVFLPTQLEAIATADAVAPVLRTLALRYAAEPRPAPPAQGMRIWLEQAAQHAIADPATPASAAGLAALRAALLQVQGTRILTSSVWAALERRTRPPAAATATKPPATIAAADAGGLVTIHAARRPTVARTKDVRERLSGVHGVGDEDVLDVLAHLSEYAAQLGTDAAGCSGCRAQSCAGTPAASSLGPTSSSSSSSSSGGGGVGCPGGKSINTINAVLQGLGPVPPSGTPSVAQWVVLRRAFDVQIQATPFIAYTGAACPAPCEGACTESIAGTGLAEPARGGKPSGDPVPIRRIEYSLYKLGRAMGWFSPEAAARAAPALDQRLPPDQRAAYDAAMALFRPPLARAPPRPLDAAAAASPAEVVVVGSGPAGMQVAYEALRDGVRVRMYERSDHPGGLLVDGIPRHKFDEAYLREDFAALVAMGLELHLNAEVVFADDGSGEFQLAATGEGIASIHAPSQQIVLCIGAGAPRQLPPAVTAGLTEAQQQAALVPATVFLKAANDVARLLAARPGLAAGDRDRLIRERFGPAMDPRGKRIVVVGGGDTAQDAVRWLARYFAAEDDSGGGLHVLVRAPPAPPARGIVDAYPALSLAPTKENLLKAAEVEFVGGEVHHLVEPVAVAAEPEGTVAVHLRRRQFLHADVIRGDPTLQALASRLPRDKWPTAPVGAEGGSRVGGPGAEDSGETVVVLPGVDLVLLALGFEPGAASPLVRAVQAAGASNVYIAGDASDAAPKIIIGAQANATQTYQGQIREALLRSQASASAATVRAVDSGTASRADSPAAVGPHQFDVV